MPDQDTTNERGVFLRFMHNFYAVYLGVTPPSPENEKKIAAVVIGGTITLVVFLVFFIRFLLASIFAR